LKSLLVILAIAPILCAQAPQAKPVPKFQVATVRRCTDSSNDTGGGPNSDSRLTISCWNLAALIDSAYVTYAGGKFQGNRDPVRVEQLNGWASSELWTIEAVAEGTPGQNMLRGPMLQKLLEDRFGLKVHTASKLEPAFNLTVGASGLQLKRFAGGCTPSDPIHPPELPIQHACPRDPRDTVASLDIFAWMLHSMKPSLVDAPVSNKTGLTGFYRFNMEPIIRLAGQGHAPLFTAVATAVQTYGLKLESTKTPRIYYVVDRVQQPSIN